MILLVFDNYKDEIEERINIIISILLDAVTIIVLLFSIYVIDYITRFLGFENEIIVSILDHYIHPIMLISVFCVSIINIFRRHLPKPDPDSRLELIYEDD